MIACLYPFLWHCGFHLHSRMFDHWFSLPSTTSFVIRHSDTSVCDGISYIKSHDHTFHDRTKSSGTCLTFLMLSWQLPINASSSNVSFTPSISNNPPGTVSQEHSLVLSKCALRLLHPMDLKIHSLELVQ